MQEEKTNTASPSAAQAREGFHALDEWAKVYPAPTSVPFELKPNGGVFRGMKDLAQATDYAEKVADFFAQHGVSKHVFVIEGPTSTTKMPYEVVDATAGRTVLYRAHARAPAQLDLAALRNEFAGLVVSALQAHGWTPVHPLDTAIAQKSFETAVGERVASVYLSQFDKEGFNCTLAGDYESEGRNQLAGDSMLISWNATPQDVQRITQAFAAQADQTISQTYAARIHQQRGG